MGFIYVSTRNTISTGGKRFSRVLPPPGCHVTRIPKGNLVLYILLMRLNTRTRTWQLKNRQCSSLMYFGA